jgi:hypothetical protein
MIVRKWKRRSDELKANVTTNVEYNIMSTMIMLPNTVNGGRVWTLDKTSTSMWSQNLGNLNAC